MIKIETTPNPDLYWEKTKSMNLETDITMPNNALALPVNYYYQRSSNLIGMCMLSLGTGFAATTIDWAGMENKGWEIALGLQNVYIKDFHQTTDLNLGSNTNKILNGSVVENSTYPGRKGHPMGITSAYKATGLGAEGCPVFVGAADEKLTTEEFFKLDEARASMLSAGKQQNLCTYMGTTDPKVSGGFVNHFEYKDWQLDMSFTFNLGMKVRIQPTCSSTDYDRDLNTNRDISSRWAASHTNTTFPRLMTSGYRVLEYVQYSEYNTCSMLDTWIRNSSYMCLQSTWLGYRSPKTWVNRMDIVNVSVSVEACNLFVFTSNYTNYLGPETMGNPFAQPIPKNVILGSNLSF